MMLTRLLQLIRRAFARPIPSPAVPPRDKIDPAVEFSFDGDPIHIEFDGMVLTFGTIEMGEAPDDDLYIPLTGHAIADDTKPPVNYYRDEDDELRPLNGDRAALADMQIEELAAEFLRAKADAEAVPEQLEREIIGALCDAYGRELWRRTAVEGIRRVQIGGRRYEIVPLPINGHVRLSSIE